MSLYWRIEIEGHDGKIERTIGRSVEKRKSQNETSNEQAANIFFF